MSPNIQESESALRKRTHKEFVDDSIQLTIEEPSDLGSPTKQRSTDHAAVPINITSQSPSLPAATMEPKPGSSSSELTELGSTPPTGCSPSPNKTPSKPAPASVPTQNDDATKAPTNPETSTLPTSAPVAQATQPEKRKLTKAERDQERAEKRQKREAEAAERAEKRAAEAIERAKREAVKLARKADEDAKRRKKEEEELAAQRKKEKQRSMLASFVQRAPTTPSKKAIPQIFKTSPKSTTESTAPQEQKEPEPQKSMYERTFQPFFVKPGVTVASLPFEMDNETKVAKSEILDQFVRGERGTFNAKPFNPAEVFNLPFPQQRGIMYPSVRKIMEGVYGDSTENTQAEKLVNAQTQLNSIPMKYLSFYEDVRPPYFGTVTSHMESTKLRKLSRRPTGALLRLNYDYDSEAEWVEDDGEDLGDEEEDEEEHDADEEMDDFLDDSDDVSTAIRPTFLGENEPTSTGICFEDRAKQAPCASMGQYRLEVMLNLPEHHIGIDPFSTSYWPTTIGKGTSTAAATSAPGPPTSMPPPAGVGIASTAPTVDAKDLVPKEMLDDFKRAIISEELRDFTKGTIIDLLAKKFPACTKAQVKATLDKTAHRISPPGAKKTVKQWALLPAGAT